MLTLRPARRDDLPLLLAWTPDAGALAMWAGPTLAWPLDLPQLEAMLAEGPSVGRTSWVAVADGAVVGHASVTANGVVARIGRILLDPARRGTGLGGALVDAVVAQAARSPGVARLTLGVLHGNTAARRHYDRLGFAPTGETTAMLVDGQAWISDEMTRAADAGPDAAAQVAEAIAAELDTLAGPTRADADRLRARLAPDFHEIGRSGRQYGRDDVTAEQLGAETIPVEGMRGRVLADGLALLTYVSTPPGRRTLRTSLWRRTGAGHWQLVHHQGTPAADGEQDPAARP